MIVLRDHFQDASSPQGRTSLLHIAAINEVGGFEAAQWLVRHGLPEKWYDAVDDVFSVTPLAFACTAKRARPSECISIPMVTWMLEELHANPDKYFMSRQLQVLVSLTMMVDLLP